VFNELHNYGNEIFLLLMLSGYDMLLLEINTKLLLMWPGPCSQGRTTNNLIVPHNIVCGESFL
jgi:hypothetical protein